VKVCNRNSLGTVLQIVDQSLLNERPQGVNQKETQKVSWQETLLVVLIDDNAKLARRPLLWIVDQSPEVKNPKGG
jgi:hypothetical protein